MARDDYTSGRASRDKKSAMVVSGNSVFREKPPTNPGTAERFTNFVFDHSEQIAAVPNSWSRQGKSGNRTMNRGGKPKALHVEIGGSPDLRSRALNSKSTKPGKIDY